MSTRFLAAAYSRRPAPKAYDPLFMNTELARIAASMTSYVIRNVTVATTMQKNDGMLVCNATAGAITVTLPSPSVGSGQPVTIKKSDASANAVTIGGTVDGVLNRTLINQNDSIVIQSDGTTWFRPMLTASGTGGTTYSLTAGTHLSGGPFNGSAAVTLTTDATPNATASTIVSRDGAGGFEANNISATSVSVVAAAPTSANVLEYSQQFGSVVWVPTLCTVAENALTAPDGTTTADSLTGTGTDSNVAQSYTSATTTRYTMSIHMQWGGAGNVRSQFGVYNATAGAWLTRINVAWDGSGNVTAVTTVAGGGGSYLGTSVGSGWWRCSGISNASVTAGDTLLFLVYPNEAGVASAGKIVYVWGVQLEAGTTLTAYAPTTAVSTTFAVTGRSALSGPEGIGIAVSTTANLALAAGTTTKTPLRIPPGVAQTTRVSGDVWGTTAGLHYHADTTTIGPMIDSGPVFLLMGA